MSIWWLVMGCFMKKRFLDQVVDFLDNHRRAAKAIYPFLAVGAIFFFVVEGISVWARDKKH